MSETLRLEVAAVDAPREPAPEWLAEIVSSWRPRAPLSGSEWAERERVLSREESPAPGPWRSVPWQRELLDALADPLVTWVVILKAAQMGVSELARCAIGRWALHDPGDVLWVMTTEDAARKGMKKLRAMFRSTPSLRPLLSDRRSDATLLELSLANGMRIVIGWAGSAQSLASDPFRYVILDEAAKYRWAVQGEASAVDLAKERTKVYGRRGKIVLLSSPKHDDDLICSSHRELADRRAFSVPCPSCSRLQVIDWSAVRWPDGEPSRAPQAREDRARLADQVERDQSAWLECLGCKGKILPHKAQWDPRARWTSELPDEAARGARRGYHVPEFLHWETTLSGLVAKWLRCMTPSALQGFWNGSLAIAYKAETSEIRAETFVARATFPKGVVPSWATAVIATADTQLRGWWFMLRAWGPDWRSRLLDWGWVEREDELVARCVAAKFKVEGDERAIARPIVFAIDSGGGMPTPDGSRTKQVYEIVRRNPRTYALKGEGKKGALSGPPWKTTKVRFSRERFGEVELDVHLINRNYYADELARLVRADDPILWEECQGAEVPTYGRQMASEQKVLVTSSSGSEWLWQKKSKGAENHLWDAARYQCWAAEFARVDERVRPSWAQVAREAPIENEERPRWKIGR